MKRLFLLPILIVLFSSFSFAQNNQEKVYVDYYGTGEKFELVTGEDVKTTYEYLARSCQTQHLRALLSKGYRNGRYVLKVDEDKSMILDDKGSTAFNIAAKSNIKECRDTARWLSDAGVADGLTGGARIYRSTAI